MKMNDNNRNNSNYKSFVVRLSLWAQGKGLPGASPAWLTRIAHTIASSKNPALAAKFIRQYGINHTQASRCTSSDTVNQCATKYGSLSNFFTRHIKDIVVDPSPIVSPATCKAMVFDSFADSKIWVKGRRWSAERLLQKPGMNFRGYSLGIFRLRPKDYHRFHSPVDCVVRKITPIRGGYLSVDPIVVGSQNVFTENTRVVLEMETVFGTCYFIAVGAAGVGKVRMTVSEGSRVNSGDELGYFDFGGSTVIFMVPKSRVWNAGIRERSLRGKETYVHVGAALV